MATIAVPHQDHIPGYTFDDVSSPSSDYSYTQVSMMTTTPGMYSYSQTGPADRTGSAWATTGEGTQNFQSYPGNQIAHPTEPEDFTLSYGGALTPPDHGPVNPRSGTEATKRLSSRSPPSSNKRRSSKASSTKGQTRIAPAVPRVASVGVTGNTSTYRTGNAGHTHGVEVSNAIFLDSETSSLGSHLYYQDLSMDMDVAPGSLPFSSHLGPLHVDPSHMHLNPDASLMGSSPTPPSWNSLTPPQSPGDDVWYHSVSSPSDTSDPSVTYGHPSPDSKAYGHEMYPIGQDLTAQGMVTGISTTTIGADGAYAGSQAMNARRLKQEGETARDHHLYRNAKVKEDGMYHCPWEGDKDCNHRPEKLKCNYDKYVDSHLRPYRCKIESCGEARFSSTACLLRHEREAHRMHGHKAMHCIYEGCERSPGGKGFPRAWNLRDHLKRVHNDERDPFQLPATSGSPDSLPQDSMEADTGRHSSSKSRRRTKDSPSSSSRKSSKSTSAGESDSRPLTRVPSPVRDEWYENRQVLEDIIRGLEPNDPRSRRRVMDAQQRLENMTRLYDGIYPGHVSSSRRGHQHGD